MADPGGIGGSSVNFGSRIGSTANPFGYTGSGSIPQVKIYFAFVLVYFNVLMAGWVSVILGSLG